MKFVFWISDHPQIGALPSSTTLLLVVLDAGTPFRRSHQIPFTARFALGERPRARPASGSRARPGVIHPKLQPEDGR
jgi:hypothetical protein